MTDVSDTLTRFAHELRSWDAPGRVVSIALDLRGRGDASPPWHTVLAEGLAATGLPANGAAIASQVDAAAAAAASSGAKGIFIASDPEGRYWAEAPTSLPPRNDIRAGDAPWLIEIERLRYLTGQPVVVATVDLHSAHVVRVTAGAESAVADTESDPRGTRSVAGRTNTEGRAGAGHAGGHSRNRTAHAIEEHRLGAGREAGAAVAEMMRVGDILVVAGIPEARALLLSHLPANLANHALTRASLGPLADPHLAFNLALDLSTAHQLDEGDAAARALLGSAGSVARGVDGVAEAAGRMQVAEIVVHEDAASHWGSADDARPRSGLGRDEELNRALRGAITGGATARFCRLPALIGEHEGVAATLRW